MTDKAAKTSATKSREEKKVEIVTSPQKTMNEPKKDEKKEETKSERKSDAKPRSKSLSVERMNQNVLKAKYAVRGEILIQANKYKEMLKQPVGIRACYS